MRCLAKRSRWTAHHAPKSFVHTKNPKILTQTQVLAHGDDTEIGQKGWQGYTEHAMKSWSSAWDVLTTDPCGLRIMPEMKRFTHRESFTILNPESETWHQVLGHVKHHPNRAEGVAGVYGTHHEILELGMALTDGGQRCVGNALSPQALDRLVLLQQLTRHPVDEALHPTFTDLIRLQGTRAPFHRSMGACS